MVSLRLNNRSKDKRFSPWGPTFVEIWRWTQWRRKPWVGTVARTLHPLGPRKCINLDFRWLSRKDIGENAGVICVHNQGLKTITVDLLTPVLFVVISWFFVSLKSLLNLLQYCCCFMLDFLGHAACGILVPQPRTEPTTPALEGEVLATGHQRRSNITCNSPPIIITLTITPPSLPHFVPLQCARHCAGWLMYLLFSHSVMSDSVRPHGLQHTSLPCPSPSPRACSNSCPLSQWYHPTVSSSVIPFSSYNQSFPASGSFPMSQLFPSGDHGIGASASAFALIFQPEKIAECNDYVPQCHLVALRDRIQNPGKFR